MITANILAMKSKLLLLTVAFSITAFFAHANTHPGNGDENKKSDILGGVINSDTKKPLSNVSVVAYNANKKEKTVMTDEQGNFSFNDLRPGTYKLVFEKEGYKKITKEKVLIRADEGCQVNVALDELGEFQMVPGLLFTDGD